MTSALLDEAKLNRIRSIYKERFGDPSGFTFYFVGNIDPEAARPVLEKYLGGLPKVTREETWRDNGVRPPVGKVGKAVMREMKDPKGTVTITYTGTYDFDDFQERLNLTALCDVLDVRYVETVREEQGGTYGVAVREQHTKFPYENYRVGIYFDCDPENTEKLKEIIYSEIEKLKTEGPTAKDLKGVVENYLKTYTENQRENGYWLSNLREHDFNDLDFSDVTDYTDYVANLTVENLKAAANRLFAGNIVEVILLPENIGDNVKNPMTGE
jgi:zinc protease